LSGAYRRRDLRRLDILVVVLALVVLSPASTAAIRSGMPIVPFAAILLFPYFLLRLVQHFREVPVALTLVGVGVPIVATVIRTVTPPPWPVWLQAATFVYGSVALLLLALTFTFESHRSAGVTARRLYSRRRAPGCWRRST
jgi:hypothetical protein